MPQRDFYIDRLRSVMTALVIFHHTAITYGAIGGWFWHEVSFSYRPSSLILVLFCTTNQAWFMGLFFLLAGYFTPASLDRKGYPRFILDRFLRLGLPLLAFGLVLGPLTAGIVNAVTGDGFWTSIAWLWRHNQFINGPLWFAQALLIFSLAYCGWRALIGPALAKIELTRAPMPSQRWWLLSALATGAATIAIRQLVPVGRNVWGLQLAYFGSYTVLFAIGIAAGRNNWLAQLTWKQALPWVLISLIAWPTLPAAWLHAGPGANFNSGLSWPAFLYAFWEPFVAWGIIAGLLLLFRDRMNAPSALWSWLGRRAYTVYIIHPPVLVGISLLLRGWAAPALVKFSAVGSLACVATWLLADPLVRLPGVRRIV